MPEDCLFCRIVSGDIDAAIVHEDEHVVAFQDIDPKAPTHVLVVPREHVADWSDLAGSAPHLAAPLFAGVAAVADQQGLDEYRVVSNRGASAGQSVFHFHLHVLGGRAMQWPPG